MGLPGAENGPATLAQDIPSPVREILPEADRRAAVRVLRRRRGGEDVRADRGAEDGRRTHDRNDGVQAQTRGRPRFRPRACDAMCPQFPRSNSVPQRLTALGKPLVVPCYTPPGVRLRKGPPPSASPGKIY